MRIYLSYYIHHRLVLTADRITYYCTCFRSTDHAYGTRQPAASNVLPARPVVGCSTRRNGKYGRDIDRGGEDV